MSFLAIFFFSPCYLLPFPPIYVRMKILNKVFCVLLIRPKRKNIVLSSFIEDCLEEETLLDEAGEFSFLISFFLSFSFSWRGPCGLLSGEVNADGFV